MIYLVIHFRYGGTIANQIKRLGASCDWSREHFTLDEQLSRKTALYSIELSESNKDACGLPMIQCCWETRTRVNLVSRACLTQIGVILHNVYCAELNSPVDMVFIVISNMVVYRLLNILKSCL